MTDAELRNFVIEFRAGLLGRRASTQACFMLCAPLSTLLTIHGVPNTLVEVWLKRPPRNRGVSAELARLGACGHRAPRPITMTNELTM
jgi:hypothetical protein